MTKILNGTIRWFDSLSGKGVIRSDSGQSYTLHFTAIKGIEKNNYMAPSESDRILLDNIKGRPCTFTLVEEVMVDACEVEGL